MIITDAHSLVEYYSKIRKRTLRIIDYIPEDKIDWTYKEGKFTFGDLIRHLACIERHMYAEAALFKPSRYKGCGKEYGASKQECVDFMNKLHAESLEIFNGLSVEQLNEKTKTPAGTPITLWKWLRAMIEHEIHHRGQIYTYLGMIDIKTPPLYGLTAEEVAERSID